MLKALKIQEKRKQYAWASSPGEGVSLNYANTRLELFYADKETTINTNSLFNTLTERP